MGPTFPNRIYSHAAQTDRITNSFELSFLPTIWDRLADRKVSAGYYFSDVPFLALWGPKYQPISHRISTFFEDGRSGKLPAVSYVDPRFLNEEQGLSNDDHPHADLRNGQAFQYSIYNAVTTSKAWRNTMLVYHYGEWGGLFDHVAPSTAPISDIDRAAGYTDGLRGFRIPAIIVAPFAQRGQVAHTVFDHTSVLRFIEWRWKLDPLTERDATAANLAEVLDFSKRNLAAPAYVVDPPGGNPVPAVRSQQCGARRQQVGDDAQYRGAVRVLRLVVCLSQISTGRAVVAASEIAVEGLSLMVVHQLRHATKTRT